MGEVFSTFIQCLEEIGRFLNDNGSIIASLGTIITSVILIIQFYQEKKRNKKKQASLISCWLDESDKQLNPSKECIIISNDSELPIYEVCVSCDDLNIQKTDKILSCIGKKEENCAYIPVIPPGSYKVRIDYKGRGMCHLFNSSITFKDTFGNYWTRNAIGVLKCHKENTTTLRNLGLPVMPSSYEKI